MHPASKDTQPDSHLGEAEVISLLRRQEFTHSVLLLDELAARGIATELNLKMSGFAGVLLLAVDEELLTADEAKAKLERCKQAGIHYSITFINRIYQTAKEGAK